MKKEYSLDFSIERDVDRVAAVKEILDSLTYTPSARDLEQLADYIMYGKDANGKNATQRGETLDDHKRYQTYRKNDDKVKSLEAIMENPLTNETTLEPIESAKPVYLKKKPTIHRPKYNKVTGAIIDRGDMDVPGMTELWERIQYYERLVAANEGRIPFADDLWVAPDSYTLYKLKHWLVDLRRHQYYLKESYRPTIFPMGVTPSQPQTYDWDADCAYWISLSEWQYRVANRLLFSISTNLSDYKTRTAPDGTTEVRWVVRLHTFDWENPWHIRNLIDYYSAIYQQTWDNLYAWGRTLIADFNRY